jgi:glycerophosphoryl diester phosphodiesterase
MNHLCASARPHEAKVRPFRLSARLAMSLCAASCIPPASAQNAAAPAADLVAAHRPLVIGHRGYNVMAPENTLPSFQMGLTAGADLVELDYHHSRDGVPVVMHDFTLDRTTDATNHWHTNAIKIAEKTLAEIRTLDAGKWFSPVFAGTKVPTLAEALEVIQPGGVTLVERKGGDPAACVKFLRDKNLVNRLVVQSFDWEYLREFHELEPTQILAAIGPPKVMSDGNEPLNGNGKLTVAHLDELARTGAKVVVWKHKAISPEIIQIVHQRKLKLWVYTVNDPKLANALLDWGADGLITDNTSLIWKTLALRK